MSLQTAFSGHLFAKEATDASTRYVVTLAIAEIGTKDGYSVLRVFRGRRFVKDDITKQHGRVRTLNTAFESAKSDPLHLHSRGILRRVVTGSKSDYEFNAGKQPTSAVRWPDPRRTGREVSIVHLG